MKIFREGTPGKSWAVRLRSLNPGTSTVNAVDTETGELICHLIVFHSGGEIEVRESASDMLKDNEYDPSEHGNTWTDGGAIRITQ